MIDLLSAPYVALVLFREETETDTSLIAYRNPIIFLICKTKIFLKKLERIYKKSRNPKEYTSEF